jgi:hypothetical protein
MQNEWRRILNDLEHYATKPVREGQGDPLAVLRYLTNTLPVPYAQLRRAAETETADAPKPCAETLRNVETLASALIEIIGPAHEATPVLAPFVKGGSPAAAKRGAELMQATVFLGAASATVFNMLIGGWGLAAGFAGAAALSAGWGELSRGGSERLNHQIGWLTEIGGAWERLQERYGLQGPQWRRVAETLMQERTNADINALLKSRKEPTPEQRTTVLALDASGTLRSPLTEMLESESHNGAPAHDFREFAGFLRQVRTPEMQQIVGEYIDRGMTRTALTRPTGPSA